MGIGDDMSDKAEELGGQGKEALGEAIGDEELQAEGILDQFVAKAKQVGESIKDFAEDASEHVKDFAEDAAEHVKDFATDAAEKGRELADEASEKIKHARDDLNH